MTGEGRAPGRLARFGPARTIGEILIIVTGVLIALAAEEFRQDRAERQMSRSYIESLAADLRADSADFAQLLAPTYLPAQAAAVDSRRVLISDPTLAAPGPTVMRYLRSLIALPFANKRRATLDDLVGSERLALIEDPELQRGLVQVIRSSSRSPRIRSISSSSPCSGCQAQEQVIELLSRMDPPRSAS